MRSVARATAGAAALVAALGACTDGMQSALEPGGPFARGVATHWWVMLAVGSVILLAVIAMFVYAIVGARRARPEGEPPAEAGDDDDTVRAKTRTVALAVGGTVVVLLGVMVHALSLMPLRASPAAVGLEIEVVGHQWWWEVHYRDTTPHREFTTANELHIPVGVPVRVRLRSQDVIHSFWVPNLQGKVDLFPGRENELQLLADRPGVWRGQCAEFCGLQHARMAFMVEAHAPDDFARWREAQLQAAAPPPTDAARRGERVFMTAQCSFCHTVRGTRAGGRAGPDLTHLASRRTLAAGVLPNTRGNLAGWILDPQSSKPGAFMPPTPLDSEQMHALLAYLESLR